MTTDALQRTPARGDRRTFVASANKFNTRYQPSASIQSGDETADSRQLIADS
jgi:hypothetical protein